MAEKEQSKPLTHEEHKLHERRVKYYKHTVSLLMVSIQIVLLVFIVVLIFLFISAGESNLLKEQSSLLISQKSKLEQQVGTLQSNQIAIVKELPLIQIKDDEVIASFALNNREPLSWTFPFELAKRQMESGYFMREVVKNELVPQHSKYAQQSFEFATFYTDDQNEINELRSTYSSQLIDIRKRGTTYIQAPLGNEVRTVMDFRPFVTSEGFEEVQDLYEKRESNQQFLETLWYIVAQLTTYSEEIEETPLYPLETILSQGGDCEDTAILFASMLKAAQTDWEISFLYMDLRSPTDPFEYNHIIVQVETETELFYIETTNDRTMNTYEEVVGFELLIP